jgi:hypothetical protein
MSLTNDPALHFKELLYKKPKKEKRKKKKTQRTARLIQERRQRVILLEARSSRYLALIERARAVPRHSVK